MTNCARRARYNVSMEVIYIDSLFFMNLVTDYLLVLAAARISGLALKRIRYALAALFGAAYSVAVFLPGLNFLSGAVWKLVFGLAVGLIAFAPERRPLRCVAVFMAVSAAFGGALWALSMAGGGLGDGRTQMSMKPLLASFTLCYAAGNLIFRCRGLLMDKRRVSVRLSFLGREAVFIALADTGNVLSDPISGAPVMVVCPHALRPVFRDYICLFSELEAVETVECAQQIPELRGRLRLIPYSAVGSAGLLPVFRADKISLDGAESSALLIAVSQNAAGDGFEAIISAANLSVQGGC